MNQGCVWPLEAEKGKEIDSLEPPERYTALPTPGFDQVRPVLSF